MEKNEKCIFGNIESLLMNVEKISDRNDHMTRYKSSIKNELSLFNMNLFIATVKNSYSHL